MSDYVFMQVILHAKAPNAFKLSNPVVGSDEVWVDHIFIEATDAMKLRSLNSGNETEIQIDLNTAIGKGLL